MGRFLWLVLLTTACPRRGLRRVVGPGLLSLIATACADLTGLNALGVGDAAIADVVAAQDASDGALADADIPPIEAGPDAGTYCASYGTWAWCADFDEGDVTMGFALGKPKVWTTVSQIP